MNEPELQSFIMLCTRYTEHTCLAEMVFGETEDHLPPLRRIRKGDPIFLYNMHIDHLLGIFIATDEVSLSLGKDLWDGRYPAQVPVNLVGNVQRISNASEKLRGSLDFVGGHGLRWPGKKRLGSTTTKEIFSLFDVTREIASLFGIPL